PRSGARCRNIGMPIATCQSRCATFPSPRCWRADSTRRASGRWATSSSPAVFAPSIMALDNLRAFIGAIDAQGTGDLVRVDRPVSVDKHITEIADRCMKSPGGGPALLFQQPILLSGRRSRYPVAVNLFVYERRMAL